MSPRAGLDVREKRNFSCPCQESNPSHPTHSLVTNNIIKNGTEEDDICTRLHLLSNATYFSHTFVTIYQKLKSATHLKMFSFTLYSIKAGSSVV
jgi:hypothetical protein